jgi:hypothetical protein
MPVSLTLLQPILRRWMMAPPIRRVADVDPASLIVAALAVGAVAGAQKTATEAVQDRLRVPSIHPNQAGRLVAAVQVLIIASA